MCVRRGERERTKRISRSFTVFAVKLHLKKHVNDKGIQFNKAQNQSKSKGNMQNRER
jgi:hypothetical protein